MSDNKNQFKNPIYFLSGIYIYILIIVTVIGFIYIENMNEITTNTIPLRLNMNKKIAELKVVEAKVVPPIDVLSMTEPSDELLKEGKTLFDNSCASCHGTGGKGDGVASAALEPKPKNFTSNDGWINGSDLSEIYKTLEEGIPNSGMASYSYLLPKEKFALGSYIRAQFVQNPEEVSEEALLNLDLEYNLSDGASIPAQIPVKFASKQLIKEQYSKIIKINDILKNINSSTDNINRDIFNNTTYNNLTALTTLSNNNTWQKSEDLFVDIIVNGVNTNGFNGNVFQLSKVEWKNFFNFMSKSYK